ncbi:unnamed protein product [Leptidea sinapis]|uniref:RING-type domain-containing protein n=1 Tax=Leptidea sinapis TaxID=189913 RepID=A0A5E4QFG0_9NEOP|nr:unnamed protein product [Leptidea sinapis]
MSVSLCVLRVEIDEDIGDMGDSSDFESSKEQKKRDRGARESKTITVETYASILSGPNSVTGLLPTSSRQSPTEINDDDTISFFCGNPLVEVTKGVLHLYKDNELKDTEEAKTLCLLSVPGALGAPDLLAFAAACQQDIAHVRVLRDAAHEFHSAFNGVPYSSLEPAAVCYTAWVSRVEFSRDGAPPPSHTELPTCPVCLERMDESVAGVLSVQCAHSFHAECLMGWRDARCPVCRCAQTPEPRERAVCLQCEAEHVTPATEGESTEVLSDTGGGVVEGLLEAEAGALWICLICDNFVHRLVQNKADGKLVASEAGGAGTGGGEGEGTADKLELTYLLTHHLDKERGLGAALAESQALARERYDAQVAEVAELREQLRDVMFFVEARGALASSQAASADEIRDASVSLPAPSSHEPPHAATRQRRRRKH